MNRIVNLTLLANPLNWVIVPLIVLLFGIGLNLLMNPPIKSGSTTSSSQGQ